MNPNHFYLVLLTMFCMSVFSTFAQSKISGLVVDDTDDVKLEKASVALLHARDSILVKFSWTKGDGSFSIMDLDTGHYKLIVSYPQYADFVQDLYMGVENKDIGTVNMSKIALLIEEVKITGKVPVIVKGDTIEYDASSFSVEKKSKVEDLLRVLPGITVDGSGKITAQGKEVKKVLLDGEEFFGDDPTLVTRNIRSDMVSKVQVYEKKSDLAVVTGIDDGERTQTIDIKLKEDKKKGMFGEALAGGGTDAYYGGKLMANKFKGAQKIAAYGIVANDGMVGLGFDEAQKYGDSGNVTMIGDGSVLITSGSDDDLGLFGGGYMGQGVPKALNMGVSFSDKSKNDKHKLNVNFKRNQIDVKNNSTYMAQDNYPENATIDNSKTFTDRFSKAHIANMRYEFKLDSLSSGILAFGYSKRDQENEESKNTYRRDLRDSLINTTENRSTAMSGRDNINLNLLMTRRFKKERRSITLSAALRSNSSDGTTNYYSLADYHSLGNKTEVDQLKYDKMGDRNLTTSLNYSEPLSKLWTGSIGYSFLVNNSNTLNESFNKDPLTGEYTVLDATVLNDFDYISTKNSTNMGLNFKNEKWTLNISNRLDFEDVKRTYNDMNTVLKRTQTSFNPMASVRYRLSKSKNVGFRYSGRTIQPDLAQIEPLKQNVDQLVNYMDNPNLSAGFNNSYSIDFSSFRPLKDKFFDMFVWVNQNINSINSKVRYYSETGKRDISYVNIDKQNWSARVSAGYRLPLMRKIGVNMSTGLSVGFNNNYNYLSLEQVDPQLNNTERIFIEPDIGLNRFRANKMDFSVSLRPGIQFLNASLQPDLNSRTFTLNSDARFTYHFPKDFKLSLNMNQSYAGATETLKSFSTFNTTGYVSKKFLKDKSLETQIFVNDILNRNNGINRFQNGYSFIQTSNDVLKRYAMFKLIYSFTTMKGGN